MTLSEPIAVLAEEVNEVLLCQACQGAIAEKGSIVDRLRHDVVRLTKEVSDLEIRLKNSRLQHDVTKDELKTAQTQLSTMRNRWIDGMEQVRALKKENFIVRNTFGMEVEILEAVIQIHQKRLERFIEEEAERQFGDPD